MAETNSVSSFVHFVLFLVDIVHCYFRNKCSTDRLIRTVQDLQVHFRTLDRICEKLALEIVHVRKNVCQNF